MIEIKSSKNADSRTMTTKEPSKEELLKNSLSHIFDVQEGCAFIAELILKVGAKHDHTKLKYLDEFFKDYSSGITGADFKNNPDGWFQKYHLTERHHLNDRVPEDVTLIDVIERIIDITMAGMARTGNFTGDTISAETLMIAYQNTIQMMVNNIRVVE